MSANEKVGYLARFHPTVKKALDDEAVFRDVSIQKVLTDAVLFYFREKGTEVWQKSISSGANSE